jgi:2-polyprenyl-3-methyl-5-hydroxy-6-metoxy-1,4-benzoquinol methylase
MNVKEFRNLLGYDSHKATFEQEKLADMAIFDSINKDEANDKIIMASIVLEAVWYLNYNMAVYDSDLFKYDGWEWYFSNAEQDFLWSLNFLEKMEFSGSILDFGGGNGEFALAASASGYDTTYYNLSGDPMEFVKWRAKRLSSKLNIISDIEDRKFDCICAFEVSEHFRRVDEFLHLLEKHRKKSDESYFIETSSFSSISCGHFSSYIFEGDGKVDMKAANRVFRRKLREDYEHVDNGWNGRPSVWKLQS